MFWRKKAVKEKVIEPIAKDYRAIALTDLGSIRHHNEDQILFVRPSDKEQRNEKGFLSIVADGMGGHAAGEVAAALATHIIAKTYYQETSASPLETLRLCMEKANEAILAESKKSISYKGMGTTCTVVAILNGALHIAHIGDSRAYLIKDRQIYQLTEDHTYVRELLGTGKINPLEALNHPQRNVLTQALGTVAGRCGDIFSSEFRLEKNDTLLLCSDGLYEYFSNEELKEVILENDFRDASAYLLDQAKSRGGHDNISLLIIEESDDLIASTTPTHIIN